MRLWLGAAFAGVSLITAAAVYLFVDDSSGRTLQSESADLAVGKTSSLADSLAKVDKLQAANELASANTETFEAWAVNRHGNPMRPGRISPPSPESRSRTRPSASGSRGAGIARPCRET